MMIIGIFIPGGLKKIEARSTAAAYCGLLLLLLPLRRPARLANTSC